MSKQDTYAAVLTRLDFAHLQPVHIQLIENLRQQYGGLVFALALDFNENRRDPAHDAYKRGLLLKTYGQELGISIKLFGMGHDHNLREWSRKLDKLLLKRSEGAAVELVTNQPWLGQFYQGDYPVHRRPELFGTPAVSAEPWPITQELLSTEYIDTPFWPPETPTDRQHNPLWRPTLLLDIAVLNPAGDQVLCWQLDAEGRWRLPQTHCQPQEDLSEAVNRSLQQHYGIRLEQPPRLVRGVTHDQWRYLWRIDRQYEGGVVGVAQPEAPLNPHRQVQQTAWLPLGILAEPNNPHQLPPYQHQLVRYLRQQAANA